VINVVQTFLFYFLFFLCFHTLSSKKVFVNGDKLSEKSTYNCQNRQRQQWSRCGAVGTRTHRYGQIIVFDSNVTIVGTDRLSVMVINITGARSRKRTVDMGRRCFDFQVFNDLRHEHKTWQDWLVQSEATCCTLIVTTELIEDWRQVTRRRRRRKNSCLYEATFGIGTDWCSFADRIAN